MPDLTPENYLVCQSVTDEFVMVAKSKSGGPGHVVTYDLMDGWRCDCKGFQFRRDCRHIQTAKTKRCSWNQYTDGGEPDVIGQRMACPKCGGPVTTRVYMV